MKKPEIINLSAGSKEFKVIKAGGAYFTLVMVRTDTGGFVAVDSDEFDTLYDAVIVHAMTNPDFVRRQWLRSGVTNPPTRDDPAQELIMWLQWISEKEVDG